MSFAIGLFYKNTAIIAADKRLTNSQGVVIRDDFNKIKIFTLPYQKVFVAGGGDKNLFIRILCQIEYLINKDEDFIWNIDIFIKVLKKITNENTRCARKDAYCNFIVMSKLNTSGNPLFYLCQIDNINEAPIIESSNNFSFRCRYAYSDNLTEEKVNEILDKCLHKYTGLHNIISNVFLEISKIDKTVSDTIDYYLL